MPGQVLLFGEYGSLNGGENSALAILPPLIELGWSFIAAVPLGSPFSQKLNDLGISNLGIAFADCDGNRFSQERIRSTICALIKYNAPDLIHCNSLSTSRLVAPVAKLCSAPALGILRDILKLSKKAISDINQLDRIVAVSDATLTWHVNQGLDATKSIVIRNGVDSKKFCPDLPPADLAEFGIQSHDRVLLFVGQIGMRKGVDRLMQAFEIVQSHVSNVHLLIVGIRHSQKREAIEFERMAIEKAGVLSSHESGVHWLGRRSDIGELMCRADLLVHPARQEPLGRVLLEAIACGLPIATTDVGGTREILEDLESDDLLTNTTEELASAIIRLLGDRPRLRRLGLDFRKQAITKFSVKRCAHEVDALYRQLTP